MVAEHDGTRTTALDFMRRNLHLLGATVLETQQGWTSTPETRSQVLPGILSAQGHAPHFCQHKPQGRLCPLHIWAFPELCLTINRPCPQLLSVCQEFCLRMRIEYGPRIISDEENPYAEDFIGPAANMHLRPGRSSGEPPWTTSAGPRQSVVAPTPRVRVRVPRVLGRSVCPFLAKNRRHSIGIFAFVTIIFPVPVFIPRTTLRGEKTWHLFFYGW